MSCRMDNELSSVTKLAAQFGLLDDMKSKWETSSRPGIDLAANLLNLLICYYSFRKVEPSV